MKDCKFCDKRGLLWLPLRYGALGSAQSASFDSLPKLSGKLGQGVSDLALTHARYAVRMLRTGYLYVLIERKGIKYWDAYKVLEDAFLYKFNPEEPPRTEPTFSCDRSTCGINASMVAIPEALEVPNVWSLFTPTLLTKAKLDEYKTNAAKYVGEGKLQTFSPADWLQGSTAQPHTLLAPELLTHVAEYLLFTQPGNPYESLLGKALEVQLFPVGKDAYAGTPPDDEGHYFGRLGSIYNTIKRIGYAAFVLHDHIGLTQELNDFRNAPLEGLEHYLAATDEYGASNQQRLQVHEAIEEVKTGLYAGIVNDSQEFLAQHEVSSDQFFERRRALARQLRLQGRAGDAAVLETDVERSLRTRAANYEAEIARTKQRAAATWKSKYENRLDTDEMTYFHAALGARSKVAFEANAARVADHLKWFESSRVVAAFDVFDKSSATAGYNFAMESALCSVGLSSCKLGEDRIDAWIKASDVDRKNLYMRGLYHNSDELIAAARQAFIDIRAAAAQEEFASAVTTAHMIKATKGLVDGFKKVDSAFDEWARNQGQTYSARWSTGREIVLYHKFSDITRTVFRTGVGGTLDKTIAACLGGWLYARLGAVTEALAYNEAMLALPKEKIASHRAERAEKRAEARRMDKAADRAAKVAAKLDGSLETLIADSQTRAREKALTFSQVRGASADKLPTNNYHQTRIGVVLGCIEMIALGEKLTHFENNSKGWLEVAGSTMAVGSIVLDTYYSAAKSIREIKPYKGIGAINKGADIVRGGFKLGAGVLGLGAGICGALLDWGKFQDAKDRNLQFIYFARMTTGFVSAGLTIAAAFSYCQPMLQHAAKGLAEHSLRFRALTAAAGLAGRLALRVRLLVWVARLNWVGLAFTALEIGYLALKDDDLQNWCEMCVFRKEKKYKNWLGREVRGDKFEGATKELEVLERSAQAVGLGG
jgi:hypothetical protein